MASWNTPTDVSTGTALTTLLWNNQLGTNGSLQYVYDELNTTQLKRNIVLHKSTNTVYGAAGNLDIAFDTIIANYADQQLNFPVTTPITNIPLPAAGMYILAYQYRISATNTVRCNVSVDDGSNSYFYVSTIAHTANILYTQVVVFYAPASSTVKLNVQTSAAGTIAAIAPSSTDGSQVLTIARI